MTRKPMTTGDTYRNSMPYEEAGFDYWHEPLDPVADAFLTSIGYVRTPHPCSFEDDGDAESGPHLTGVPEYDEYVSEEDTVYVYHGEGGCGFELNQPYEKE